MESKLFTGFKLFFEKEKEEDTEYTFSNRARTLYHKANINPDDIDKMGSFPVVPSILKFEVGNKPPWEDEDGNNDDDTVKWYEILKLGNNFARIREVTGRCDSRLGNKDNQMAQCSPTSGKILTITGKELDWLTTHIAGQSQGGMGMGGGGMGGGMMPPPSPSGGMGGGGPSSSSPPIGI